MRLKIYVDVMPSLKGDAIFLPRPRDASASTVPSHASAKPTGQNAFGPV